MPETLCQPQTLLYTLLIMGSQNQRFRRIVFLNSRAGGLCAFTFSILTCLALFTKLAAEDGSESRSPTPVSPMRWEAIADDLEMTSWSSGYPPFFGKSLLFLRSSLQKFRVGVLLADHTRDGTSNVKDICNSHSSVLCINANFFDEQVRPLGLVVQGGQIRRKIHDGGNTLTGVFGVSRIGPKIESRVSAVPESYLEAVQAGPRLLVDGEPVASLRNSSLRSRRSGLCLDAKGRLIFFVLSSGFFGISQDELQSALLLPEIACKEALNLDGGGSSQLFVKNSIPNQVKNFSGVYIPGADEVPVVLALFPVDQSR